MSGQVAAVVFDYGGVLTTPVRESIASWLASDGIEPAGFSAALKEWLSRDAPQGTPVHRLETGELPLPEFERLLAARLTGLDGAPVRSDGLMKRLFAGMRPDPAMIDLVRGLRAAGVPTALLSNSWGNTYPRPLIEELFDAVVISGEVGLRKPDPRIYRLALERVGVADPERAVFVDDAAPNVEAASALGIQAVLHTGAEQTAAELARLRVLPAPTDTDQRTR